MGSELERKLLWTFAAECPIPEDINDLLVPGEQAIAAFKTVRDKAIFTNKRLIVRDSQGISGKKIEMYSLPYESIDMWSTENAGALNLSAEVEFWARAGHIKISLARDIDIRQFDKLIANVLLK